jgi:hypothetical protein
MGRILVPPEAQMHLAILREELPSLQRNSQVSKDVDVRYARGDSHSFGGPIYQQDTIDSTH